MSTLLQLFADGLILGAYYAILAVSFAIIVNTTRVFHVSHAGTFVLGGYIGWATLNILGLPLWVCIVATMVASAGIGALLELLVYRPLRRADNSPVVALLASIGLAYCMQSIGAFTAGFYPKLLFGKVAVGYKVAGIYVSDIGIASIIACIFVFAFVIYFINHTVTGIKFKAISSNPTLANIWGVSFDKIVLIALVVGSALVGIGSLIRTAQIGMMPYAGWEVILIMLMSYLIGGMGSFIGPGIAGLLLGIATCIIPWRLPDLWTQLIIFAILYVFISLRPKGILGRKVWLKEV